MALSNKSFIVLLGISIILLMLGFVLFKEEIVGWGVFGQGNVSINLSSETSILVKQNINFGSGRVNSTLANATLDSSQASAYGGTWNWLNPQYVYVENDGTVNISVNITASDNATAFVSGTNPKYQIKGIVTEPNSCTENFNTTYFDLKNMSQSLCGLLRHAHTVDSFNISIKLVVPSDASAGIRTSTLTFTGKCLSNCA